MLDNYFTLFGLPQQFTQNAEIIQSRYYQLQQSMHPDQFVGKSLQEQEMALTYSAQINEAYHVLKDPFTRARYLLKLQGKFWADEMAVKPSLPMELLMEQMALREELEALQSAPLPSSPSSEAPSNHTENWQAFKSKIADRLSTLLQQLHQVDNPAVDDSTIKELFHQIPFYLRLKSSIDNHESRL